MLYRRSTTLFLVLFFALVGSLTDGRACGGEVPQSLLVQEKPLIIDVFARRLLFADNGGESTPMVTYDDLQKESMPGRKSPSTAMLLSVLVPGTGQMYAGAKTKSRIFFSTEAALWLFFGGSKYWGDQKENEFKSWAARHAGIDPDGKSDHFWQMITYYDSREDYEIYGRADEPDRQSFPSLVGWDWKWDSGTSQAYYRQIRNSAKGADRRASFSLGAMLVNRVIAAIDAYRSAKSHNRRLAADRAKTGFRLKGTPFGKNQKILVFFERVF